VSDNVEKRFETSDDDDDDDDDDNDNGVPACVFKL
jgi:hypothetical protein